MNSNAISILIAGDVVPTPANEQLFHTGDIEALVGAEILELFDRSDISTINLECPITTHGHRIEKQGPNLKASPQSIEGIRKLNPTIIGLANNHILDYGEKGLLDTVSLISQKVIPLNCVGKDFSDVLRSNYLLVKVFGSDPILVYNSTESIND
jgi:poly-gamma-glutamate synthesis protein (capsule biosynthesis protein)